MPIQVEVHLNQGQLNRLLRDPAGPVGIYMQRLGKAVVNDAKRNAPVRTGQLRNSIKITSWPGPGLSIEIGATAPYALAVHEGHRGTQTIQGKPIMRFPGKKRGGIVFSPQVKMGSTKANPFLYKALESVIHAMA